jgi:hypothetical protein
MRYPMVSSIPGYACILEENHELKKKQRKCVCSCSIYSSALLYFCVLLLLYYRVERCTNSAKSKPNFGLRKFCLTTSNYTARRICTGFYCNIISAFCVYFSLLIIHRRTEWRTALGEVLSSLNLQDATISLRNKRASRINHYPKRDPKVMRA